MLSNYCKKIGDKLEIKVGGVKKLIPNLCNKTIYVVHYRNLQLYLSLGMKLTKNQRMLNFKQSVWMKKYIDFNTEKKRMNVANGFEKDFLKLMINSVYGKTMKNLRKRINVRLVNNVDFLKHTSKPTYITHKIFGKDYAAIHEIKPVLILNKPIFVRLTILDLNG